MDALLEKLNDNPVRETAEERAVNTRVRPRIRQVNKYANRAGVAISNISPIHCLGEDGERVSALNIRVEGSIKRISYFNRLIDEANLKIS